MSVANSTSFVCGKKRKGERERERKKKKSLTYTHTCTHLFNIFFLNNLIFLHKVHSLNSLIDIYMVLIDSWQSWLLLNECMLKANCFYSILTLEKGLFSQLMSYFHKNLGELHVKCVNRVWKVCENYFGGAMEMLMEMLQKIQFFNV
jgi:hypothetical protein